MSDREKRETTERSSVAQVDPLAKLQRIAEVMRMVADDCETDALGLDSVPFTPRGVGEKLGEIFAAVQAVARAVEVIAIDLGSARMPQDRSSLGANR